MFSNLDQYFMYQKKVIILLSAFSNTGQQLGGQASGGQIKIICMMK
jgi:hypothetical protein